MRLKKSVYSLLLVICIFLTSCVSGIPSEGVNHSDYYGKQENQSKQSVITKNSIPEYDGSPYVELENNKPDFKEKEITTDVFEQYSQLDSLGRCGVAYANICKELMPTEKRGKIGMIKPSGWHTVKYDFVDGKYLYNRCHLIGFQLAGENANEKNLITGTRYMNVEGMLPFEDEVADYVKKTNHHVLYRVTPIYTEKNLVADGVEMEANSVEDKGKGVCFHVFVYNCQPGVSINYATGESTLEKNTSDKKEQTTEENKQKTKNENTTQETSATFILNKNTKKFHKDGCSGIKDIKERNKTTYTGTREEVISMGYEPCQRCKP